jgi:hypothetical protein
MIITFVFKKFADFVWAKIGQNRQKLAKIAKNWPKSGIITLTPVRDTIAA